MHMKILIIRNMGDQINVRNYNVQEIGLAKALVKRGHECDIVFYSLYDMFREEKIHVNDDKFITLYWVKGINIYYNSIFLKLIKNKFFDNYDIIQTHEYNQLMTFILPYVTKSKLVIYHGPYMDIKNKLIHNLFDMLFLRSIRKNYSQVITKSLLSQKYLLEKGFRKVDAVGVGFDPSKFINCIEFEKSDLYKFKDKFENKPTLLYIGKLENRRNIEFLIEVVKELKKTIEFNFLLIGDGEEEYKFRCFEKVKKYNLNDSIIYINKLSQDQIINAYKVANILLLPTNYEIFGMVILESMYANCPVLTSYNGGSSTLLVNEFPEMVIDKYVIGDWVKRIILILNNEKKYELKKFIEENFIWDALSNKFEEAYKRVLDTECI